jgi:very-short-patch-repair endonuclease
MLNPTRTVSSEERNRSDSQFERDVFRLISDRGFHVRTQVCVGDPTNHRYRIDLVVEGMQGRLAVECDGDQWHGPERYEQDMARQRDLERAGWHFVRIRGSDFYRDSDRATSPIWSELEQRGIRPGGLEETMAEPPPPADLQSIDRIEVEDEVSVDASSSVSGAEADLNGEDLSSEASPLEEAISVSNGPDAPFADARLTDKLFAQYISYNGPTGPDPRTVNIPAVADGLCRIIEAEGPMIAKRAYNIYLRGCGIRRLGRELQSTMNKALQHAVRNGRVISENEAGTTGLILSTVRSNGTPLVKLRFRGPRTFEEIPPGELRAIGAYLKDAIELEHGSDEHLRAILESFDLKRLTTQVGTSLLQILEQPDMAIGS